MGKYVRKDSSKFTDRSFVDFKSKHIQKLKEITTMDIKEMKLGKVRTAIGTKGNKTIYEDNLRRFLYQANKAVYDQYKRTETAVKSSNGQLRSYYIENLKDEYKIRRLSVNKINKMTRQEILYEIQRLKYATNQKTFTIKGSEDYTSNLNKLHVNADSLAQTSAEDWKTIRGWMELYGSEQVIEAYAENDYDLDDTEEYINNGFQYVVHTMDPEEDPFFYEENVVASDDDLPF